MEHQEYNQVIKQTEKFLGDLIYAPKNGTYER